MLTIHTFGDSVLDCGRYNDHGVNPGQLLVDNDPILFPDFEGQDLVSRGPAELDHRARDGATVGGLTKQVWGLEVEGRSVALVSIGGNDLIVGLMLDRGPGLEVFRHTLNAFLEALPIRPVLLANVYDPTFGDDSTNFLGVNPKLGRENHKRINGMLDELAGHYGTLVDLHGHFLKGDRSWFTHTIEPSLTGASEVRRVFLPHVLALEGIGQP